MIKITDIHWTAGFLEGEGSFIKEDRQVEASQVEIGPLEKLRTLFGGRIRQRVPRNKNHHSYYSWSLYSIKAAGLMLTIFSLMSTKRQGQIRRMLEIWLSKKVYNPNKIRCPKGHLLSGSNIIWQTDTRGKKEWIGRSCRTCFNTYRRKWRAIKRLELVR